MSAVSQGGQAQQGGSPLLGGFAAAVPMPAQRPKLDLGPMTGSPDYILDRLRSLVDTFSVLLDRQLELRPASCGHTDCESFVAVPLHEPDAYLVGEHEISHCLFGTDPKLAKEVAEKATERLLLRAGMKRTQPEAQQYAKKLDFLMHRLWNLLEDHRCWWLWCHIYPGGGSLLEERWRNIVQHDRLDEECQKNLHSYLSRLSMGVVTPDAPDGFRRCDKPMKEALNLVEGVDAGACLAVTARLVDRIADELLDAYPPTRQEEAQQKLQQLAGLDPGEESEEDEEDNGPGDDDLHEGDSTRRPTAAQHLQIQRLLSASDEDEDDEGPSSFSQVMQGGADKMEARIEAARQAMSLPRKGLEELKEEALSDACQQSGIEGHFVYPIRGLPGPSQAAAGIRHHLERVRMRLRQRLIDDGDDPDIESFIEAKLEQKLDDQPLFRQQKKEAGLELLVLIDVSGSMYGSGLTLVTQAVADVHEACRSLNVQLTLWGFSDRLYFFKTLGSPEGARGLVMGGTSMVQALEVAAEWARDWKSRRAIVLMTDGFPTTLRAKNSTGDCTRDLAAVLEEMRRDDLVLSVLAIGDAGSRATYDTAFGLGGYGLLGSMTDVRTALPETCKLLVEAHLRRTLR